LVAIAAGGGVPGVVVLILRGGKHEDRIYIPGMEYLSTTAER